MVSSMQYKEICFSAMEVVKTAASYVRQQHENRSGFAIEEKGRQNFVQELEYLHIKNLLLYYYPF